MKTIVIVEHDNKVFKQTNLHVLTAAKQLNHEIDLFIIGYQCDEVVKQASHCAYIKKVLVADAQVYQHQLAENTAALIAEIAKNYDYILAPATTFGKNLLPRVAALMDVAMISDVIKIETADTFVRPTYAGNVLTTIKSEDAKKIISIRMTAFSAASAKETQSIPVEKISQIVPNTDSQFENQELTASSRPDLADARIVVSGGRGLKSAENFKLIEELADLLGAAVGASRAAVDAGFAPNDYQVGQTGKIVAPELYIAIGISGAIQHLAGMKDSKVIVAINNDPDAPIFQIADYGLVGDLFSSIQELRNELSKSLSH